MFVQIGFNCEIKDGLSWYLETSDFDADESMPLGPNGRQYYMRCQVTVVDVARDFELVGSGEIHYIPISFIEDLNNVERAFTVALEETRALVESDRLSLGAAKLLEAEIEAIRRMIGPKPGMQPLPRTPVTSNMDLLVPCNYLPVRQFTCIVDLDRMSVMV
jgi:hypothetical protein